jgi:hypothetical protein
MKALSCCVGEGGHGLLAGCVVGLMAADAL